MYKNAINLPQDLNLQEVDLIVSQIYFTNNILIIELN